MIQLWIGMIARRTKLARTLQFRRQREYTFFFSLWSFHRPTTWASHLLSSSCRVRWSPTLTIQVKDPANYRSLLSIGCRPMQSKGSWREVLPLIARKLVAFYYLPGSVVLVRSRSTWSVRLTSWFAHFSWPSRPWLHRHYNIIQYA